MALVTSDPELCGGTPCFAGTRVPVESLFQWLRGGHTVSAFLDNFPTVEPWQVDAVLKQAEAEVIGRAERIAPATSHAA